MTVVRLKPKQTTVREGCTEDENMDVRERVARALFDRDVEEDVCDGTWEENEAIHSRIFEHADAVIKVVMPRIEQLEAQLKAAMSDMAHAEQLISAHVEEYHDFDYEPHAVPSELSSLRSIQHHLLGSMLDERGSLIVATHAKATATTGAKTP